MTPEKKVEQQIISWCFVKKWSVDVFESKATFSAASGSYKRSKSMRVGTPDILGCDDKGHAVFIELKAPKKEDVCRIEQREFLLRKIKAGAFACVVSSATQLNELYSEWSSNKSKEFLESKLPKKVLVRGKVINLYPLVSQTA